MASYGFHTALLRPPILHILRAAGFHATRPAALDTLVDLASRYLVLLANKTAIHAVSNHNDLIPSVTDVRMALQEVGAISPQISSMEEQCRGEEDLRGMEAFLAWMMGMENQEVRRIAGLIGSQGEVVDVEVGVEREDFLTALKKKHSKTGEESRYQGTVLGKSADERLICIEGGQVESIGSWERSLREAERNVQHVPLVGHISSAALSSVSSPLSEI